MIISTYYQTSWIFKSISTLYLPKETRIRYLTQKGADELKSIVRSRNLFTRHSWENNYYLEQVKKLGKQTIIEVMLPGEPNDVLDIASNMAQNAEKIVLLSTVFYLKRKKLQRILGISHLRDNEIKFIADSNFQYLRSRTHSSINKITRITIDDDLIRRFEKNGFPNFYKYCISDIQLAKRLTRSMQWLIESRFETSAFSSVVKTSIALETLLVFNQSEPLTKVLSERCAFILSPNPEVRYQISAIIKKFYNFRSGIVHGGKKRLRNFSINLVEGVDRLLVMIYLIFSANPSIWKNEKSIENWCNIEKWKTPSQDIIYPYSKNYLHWALKLAESQKISP